MDIQASQLPRVIACNGSISMEASPAFVELPSTDREEGIAAHHVATAVLTGLITDPVEYVERQTPNGIFVTPEMAEHVAVYTDNVAGMSYMGEALIGVEQNVDFQIGTTEWICRARPDWFAYDPTAQILYIKDFKYGYRLVDPFESWTLIAYAVGICVRFNYTPTMIVFEIVQPRPNHRDGPVREWSIAADELAIRYASMVGVFNTLDDSLNSNPHCHECKALATCDAAKRAAYNAVEASSVAFTDQLSGEALAFEIRTLRRASKALDDKLAAYEELAIYRIDNLGSGPNAVPGYNSEQQYGNRAYSQGITPETIAMLTGKALDEVTTRKVITPAALERLGVSEAVVATMTYRPPTKRKLVEFDATKAAKKLGFTG